MATTSKITLLVRDYTKRASPSEVHTADVTPKTTAPSVSTTEDVIREMVASGIPIEQILIPGQGKKDVLFIADDFNDYGEEFVD